MEFDVKTAEGQFMDKVSGNMEILDVNLKLLEFLDLTACGISCSLFCRWK
ncbi:MAG TPA: hypothetical protein VF248_03625 [Nitrososphaeraceae archaeon]